MTLVSSYSLCNMMVNYTKKKIDDKAVNLSTCSCSSKDRKLETK